jgi:hypothetical protein
MSATSRPTTRWLKDSSAAVSTLLPRPIVNTKPWPHRSAAASVRNITYAAE